MIQVKVARAGEGLNTPTMQTGATTIGTDTLLKRIRTIAIFETLSAGQLRRLASGAAPRRMRSRETLYEQDDPAGACFAVLAGTLRFSVRLGKQTATSGLAFANDIFGLESLRRDGRRPETAVAGGPSEVLEIGGDFFRQFVLDNPGFHFHLLNYVIAKHHEKSCHAVHTGHYDAEQRLAAYLIDNCEDRPLQGCRNNAALSQADLADYLALTPETLCRKVSKFRKLGWIGGRGSDYVIKKPSALQSLLKQ